MKALLAITDKGSAHITAEDIALNFKVQSPGADLVKAVRDNAKTASEAAAIIFVHATCENAVFELIKLLVTYDPAPWIECIAKKEISFMDASSHKIEEIRTDLFDGYLENDLKKKSFPVKVQTLFRILKPGSIPPIIPNFHFKEDALVAIDKLRHRLVHEPRFVSPIPDVPAKLIYMVNTLRLLVALAERKYPGTHNGL